MRSAVFDAAEMAARARDMLAVPKALNSEIQALAGAGEVAAEYAAGVGVSSLVLGGSSPGACRFGHLVLK